MSEDDINKLLEDCKSSIYTTSELEAMLTPEKCFIYPHLRKFTD